MQRPTRKTAQFFFLINRKPAGDTYGDQIRSGKTEFKDRLPKPSAAWYQAGELTYLKERVELMFLLTVESLPLDRI